MLAVQDGLASLTSDNQYAMEGGAHVRYVPSIPYVVCDRSVGRPSSQPRCPCHPAADRGLQRQRHLRDPRLHRLRSPLQHEVSDTD